MNNYQLTEDEVVLYKGEIILSGEQEKSQLFFTNLNIIFVTTIKNIFSSEEKTFIEKYPVEEIKIYKDEPQIKINKNVVEIYLKTTEKSFSFVQKNELNKFKNEVLNFFSGKTTAERKAEKIKSGISLVDNTLGIDSVKVVGDALKNSVGNSINKGLKSIKNMFKKQ